MAEFKELTEKEKLVQEMLDKHFPGVTLEAISKAWLAYECYVQTRYIDYAIEQPNDLHTYENALYDKAMDAAIKGAPDAEKIMKDAERFSELIH